MTSSIQYPDGSRYEGEFLGEKPYGRGTLYWPSGKVRYQGEIELGAFKKGTHFSENGKSCEGKFKDDKPFGVCKLYRKDRTLLYVGTVDRTARAFGYGKEYREDGVTVKYEGLFKAGSLSLGRMWHSDGSWRQGRFEGDFFYGEIHRFGQYFSYVIRGIWDLRTHARVQIFEQNNQIVEFFRNVIGTL